MHSPIKQKVLLGSIKPLYAVLKTAKCFITWTTQQSSNETVGVVMVNMKERMFRRLCSAYSALTILFLNSAVIIRRFHSVLPTQVVSAFVCYAMRSFIVSQLSVLPYYTSKRSFTILQSMFSNFSTVTVTIFFLVNPITWLAISRQKMATSTFVKFRSWFGLIALRAIFLFGSFFELFIKMLFIGFEAGNTARVNSIFLSFVKVEVQHRFNLVTSHTLLKINKRCWYIVNLSHIHLVSTFPTWFAINTKAITSFAIIVKLRSKLDLFTGTTNFFLYDVRSHDMNLSNRFALWLGSSDASTSFEPLCILTHV